MLKLAVMGRSRKENEQRHPIHPDHFDQIPESVRSNLWFEEGCAEPFHVSDEALRRRFGGVGDRASLLADSDVVLLPKPLAADLCEMRKGTALWGWPHCVQQVEITQVAIDRRLTLIAWEAMFSWKGEARETHLFDRNNELAGYCGVIHALGLTGRDGYYGGRSRCTVLSHGSVSRGAIYALQGRGFHDIGVYTQRPPWIVHDKVPGCRYGRMIADDDGGILAEGEDGRSRPLFEVLAASDVIVNGILQNTAHPLMFLRDGDERRLEPGTLIVDVSCDEGMGFPFARPTSFEEPIFRVDSVLYYAVDHTPSYLWRSASWELSRVVVPLLETVMGGPAAWDRDETIRRAIEIRDGMVLNPKVLSFQRRSESYPHPVGG